MILMKYLKNINKSEIISVFEKYIELNHEEVENH